jgi:hypothetical protein
VIKEKAFACDSFKDWRPSGSLGAKPPNLVLQDCPLGGVTVGVHLAVRRVFNVQTVAQTFSAHLEVHPCSTRALLYPCSDCETYPTGLSGLAEDWMPKFTPKYILLNVVGRTHFKTSTIQQ